MFFSEEEVHELIERFCRYVKVDTQSDPDSSTFPSTEKQKLLGAILAEELVSLGAAEVEMDPYGYVYATLPSTIDQKDGPVVAFCSHMDTSPDCSGAHVKPLIHRSWNGEPIVLPDDPTQIIRMEEHPDLADQLGNDLITASGTTLLGADNKSGLAAIMTAAGYLLRNPQIPHGKIRLVFTPDEEIGRGTDYIDLTKLGADVAYTVDGETRGSVENETFSANGARVTIHGVAAHPGFAYKKLVNALKVAGDLLHALPSDRLSPETTKGRDGFIHPVSVQGTSERATVEFILRDFEVERLDALGILLHEVCAAVGGAYPQAKIELEIYPQYRNMREILDQRPEVIEKAILAISRAGISPKLQAIRGGTDGSRLSWMGLPCPNLFAGEHAFHSKLEWVSVQDMAKSAEVLVHLAQLWTEK
ncbi:MAG: peptidase T [Spirosomataceae bacterium]